MCDVCGVGMEPALCRVRLASFSPQLWVGGLPITLNTLDFTDWGSRRRRGFLTVTQLVGPGRPQPAPSPV